MRILVKAMDLVAKMATCPPAAEPTFALRTELWKLVRGTLSVNAKKDPKTGQVFGVELHLEPLGPFSVMEVPEAAVRRLGRDPRGLIILTPKTVEADPGVFVKGRKLIV